MTHFEPPSFSQLLDWLEGRLDGESARLLESRLAEADVTTEADLSWLRQFLDIAETARTEEPPPEIRENLARAFLEFRQERKTAGLFERLKATLSFDSLSQPALAGVRSVQSRGMQRQMIYDSEIAEVALNIHPNIQDKNLTMTGQVFPKKDLSVTGLIVQLVDAARFAEHGMTRLDDLGEFTLSAIPQGRYHLYISSAGYEIAIPEIDLQR